MALVNFASTETIPISQKERQELLLSIRIPLMAIVPLYVMCQYLWETQGLGHMENIISSWLQQQPRPRFPRASHHLAGMREFVNQANVQNAEYDKITEYDIEILKYLESFPYWYRYQLLDPWLPTQ